MKFLELIKNKAENAIQPEDDEEDWLEHFKSDNYSDDYWLLRTDGWWLNPD